MWLRAAATKTPEPCLGLVWRSQLASHTDSQRDRGQLGALPGGHPASGRPPCLPEEAEGGREGVSQPLHPACPGLMLFPVKGAQHGGCGEVIARACDFPSEELHRRREVRGTSHRVWRSDISVAVKAAVQHIVCVCVCVCFSLSSWNNNITFVAMVLLWGWLIGRRPDTGWCP